MIWLVVSFILISSNAFYLLIQKKLGHYTIIMYIFVFLFNTHDTMCMSMCN